MMNYEVQGLEVKFWCKVKSGGEMGNFQEIRGLKLAFGKCKGLN